MKAKVRIHTRVMRRLSIEMGQISRYGLYGNKPEIDSYLSSGQGYATIRGTRQLGIEE
jgi:hypothetical protein